MKDQMAEAGPLTILVTGGAGFVGSHLCDALLGQGHRVICLDSFLTGARGNVAPLANHPRFSLVEQDICEPFRSDLRLDRIYNLACPASPVHYQADPVHTMMTCVLGVGRMLDLAAAHGARLLQASTSEVYGDPEEHPQRESYHGRVSCTGPRACYDEGKRAAETLCFDSDRQGRVETRVARIFNTYGPRMQPDDGRVVSNLIVQALAGETLTIHGHGEQTRSFCYVTDLVRGLMALMEADIGPARPINLGNPGEFTVRELGEIVLRLTGSRSGFRHMPMPKDDPGRRRPDISLAGTLLGWRPTVPLEDGLRRTIDHFRAGAEMPMAPKIPPRAAERAETPCRPAGRVE